MNAARILRRARRRAGLSQRALAEQSGIPQPAIARIETGVVSPRLDTMARLLAAAGSTLELAPCIGAGVDRTLIRRTLARSPEERVRSAEVAGRNLAVFRRAVGHGKPG
jgi:predicted transcriptional regulator